MWYHLHAKGNPISSGLVFRYDGIQLLISVTVGLLLLARNATEMLFVHIALSRQA